MLNYFSHWHGNKAKEGRIASSHMTLGNLSNKKTQKLSGHIKMKFNFSGRESVCSVYSEFVTYGILLGQLIYRWKNYFCHKSTMSILGAQHRTQDGAVPRADQGLGSRQRNFPLESETQK